MSDTAFGGSPAATPAPAPAVPAAPAATIPPAQPFNDPAAPSNTIAPRLRVLSGGTAIPGAISVQTCENNWYHANTFKLTFALYADPAFGIDWWSRINDLLVEVDFGVAAPDGSIAWQQVITGLVDKPSVDVIGATVSVEGRDLTARFMEAKTNETFQNQSLAQIVTTLAARHGMTANVTATTAAPKVAGPAATPPPAGEPGHELRGRYRSPDHTHHVLNQHGRSTTEWDAMVDLARKADLDLFVTGTVLNLTPAVTLAGSPWVIKWTPPQIANGVAWGARSNVTNLRIDRALPVARGLKVTVKSFSAKSGKTITVTATSQPAARAIGAKVASGYGAAVQSYNFVHPELTRDQANAWCNAQLANLSKRERNISFDAPGDLDLTARTPLRLDGTGSDWDQGYFVDSINRKLSWHGGHSMAVCGKNQDARAQVTPA